MKRRKRSHTAPEPNEQSGSAGRDPGPTDDKGADSGQGKYGQSGFGQGEYDKGNSDSPYERGTPGRRTPRSEDSNEGSGQADKDESRKP
jgi:hypothetical protein